MRIWIKERLLWAGQGNENGRDHIFGGPFISWMLVEKSDHCRENNVMNKAMVVEHYGLCEKQKISGKKYMKWRRENIAIL